MAEKTSMTLERLQQLLDAYGSDSRRWPMAERDAALALLAASETAQALQAGAARFDQMLDLVPPVEPSPALADAIVAAALPSPWRRLALSVWPFGPAWQPAMALTAALLFGVVIGPMLPEQTLENADAMVAWTVDDVVFGSSMALENEDAP